MNYFRLAEFECKCGCGTNNIDAHLIDRLNTARDIAGVPFVITSGVRCKKHNKAVGGVSTSAHVKGLAVDIATNNSADRYKVLNGVIGAGFARIGISNKFIHVDIDETKPSSVTWVYN